MTYSKACLCYAQYVRNGGAAESAVWRERAALPRIVVAEEGAR